jgi:lysophospholipase L1-like esterase
MTMTWTAAFRSAPVSPFETVALSPSRSFRDETLRQVVRVRGGGDRLRVRLSNLFGKQPLTVARTRVAAWEAGSSISAATARAVTFGGAPYVGIGAGEEAVSDPVHFPLEAESDLVVSTYLPSETGPATYHSFALQTGYVARGDVTSTHELFEPAELESRYYLSGIDVWAHTGRRVVVAFGDSLTNGSGTTPDTSRRYPDQLNRLLGGRETIVVNQGISGNRLLGDEIGERGLTRFDRDVLTVPGATHVIVQLGVNDLGMPGMHGFPTATADDLIAALTSIAHRARQAGLTPIIATVPPFGGAIYPGFDTPEGEETRQHLNRWIRASQETVNVYNAVADFDHALHDTANPATLLPRYDSGDHLHPNDFGAEVMADVAYRVLLP